MSKHRGGKSRRQNTYEETPRDNKNALKDVIRRQQKEINNLRKELNRKIYEDSFEQHPIYKAPKKKCEHCGSEDVHETPLGIKTMIKCHNCNKVKTVKTSIEK